MRGLALIGFATLAACGTSAPPCEPLPAYDQCGAPLEVDSACAVLGRLPRSGWPYALSPRSGRPRAGTFVARRDLVLDADTFEVEDCGESCYAVRFAPSFDPDVTVVERDSRDVMYTAERVEIRSGTTFRLSAFIFPEFPFNPFYAPVISIEEPCATSCEDGESLCELDARCYADGELYCLGCQGLARDVCACAGLPEGSTCQFYLSPDRVANGTCTGGTCIES